MNSARKPLRLNSDPSHGYDKDYHRYSGGHGRGYSRRSSSPDRDNDRGGRDSHGMYSKYGDKYNNHRQDSRDYGKYGRAKDIRDSDRDRDRSPRDRKNWDYKDKIRDKDNVDSRHTGHSNHSSSNHSSNNLTSFGDWSEQISSNGKKYYYNSKTEVSQWEKPREWSDAERQRQPPMDKSRDWNDHDKSRSNSVKLYCDRNNRSSQDKHGLDHRSSPVSSSGRHRGDTRDSRDRSHRGHHSTTGHYNDRGQDRSGDSRPRLATVSECSTGDATPTSETGDTNDHDQHATNNGTHPGGAVSLSAAMSRISQPQVGLTVNTAAANAAAELISPGLEGVSPPTPTHDSSLPSPSLVSRLPSLPSLPTPVTLTPSLSKLYKEQLIGHVLAWPAEHVERGINKVGEDANQISNHHITKVSADLKMARSLVRLAEIQATLQEQRILFLRQQMTDLDRMDTSWATRAPVSTTPTRDTSSQHRDSHDSSSQGSPSSQPGSLDHHHHPSQDVPHQHSHQSLHPDRHTSVSSSNV